MLSLYIFLCFSAPHRFKLLQQHGSSTCTKHHTELCGLFPAQAIAQYGKRQVAVIMSCERGQNVTGVSAMIPVAFMISKQRRERMKENH